MNISTLILLAVIALLIWSQAAPTSFAAAKDNAWGRAKAKLPTWTTNSTNTVPPPSAPPATATQALAPALPPATDTPAPANSTNTTPTPSPPPSQDAICARTLGDYPDYYGTDQAGQTCAQQPQPDYACLANPPTWYDGALDLLKRASTPDLRCCLSDGKCRW